MREKFLVFGAPKLGQAEIDEVVETIKSGWIGTGPRVAAFEKEFAAYKGAQYAAALNSCTAALHLSMIAANLEPGDEVITTPMTFVATINTIIHAGATPVLADVNPKTFNIDPASIESKITARTKAILPVHFAGRCCDMDAIMSIADRHGLTVIEDCAHAIETEWKGRKAGTFGQFSCFSFYVTKNVVTGEGGLVLAKDEEAIKRIKVLGLHGMSADAWKRFSDAGYKHYYLEEAGFKYNLTDMAAALGLHQLAKVEENWLVRERIWNRYQEAFADLPLALPAPVEPDSRHAYHLYTILIDPQRAPVTRDEFLAKMVERKIGVGVHYMCAAEHPYYKRTFGWKLEDYPVATHIGRQTVSLPISPKLTDQDVQDVIDAVRGLLTA